MTDIRYATQDDAEIIHRFIVDLATYEKEPQSVTATPDDIRDQLAEPRPPFGCLIAERDGQPVGFALYFYSYSTWRGRRGLYVEDIYVPSGHRGTGVGSLLFAELARIATKSGCARMEWAVLDWNHPAIEFYERLGATPMTGWTIYRLDSGEIAAREVHRT